MTTSRIENVKIMFREPYFQNCSHISHHVTFQGYKHKGKFIAAQGPKDCTINDFWRMIWDQNVSTVIMVTNLVEGEEVGATYPPTHVVH